MGAKLQPARPGCESLCPRAGGSCSGTRRVWPPLPRQPSLASPWLWVKGGTVRARKGGRLFAYLSRYYYRAGLEAEQLLERVRTHGCGKAAILFPHVHSFCFRVLFFSFIFFNSLVGAWTSRPVSCIGLLAAPRYPTAAAAAFGKVSRSLPAI